MKVFFFTLLSLLISAPSFGQNKTWEQVIDQLDSTATLFLQSFVQKDWDTYTAHTHDNIKEMAGGKDIIIKLADETISMYKSIGYSLQEGKVAAGNIETIDSAEGIQAIVPAALVMTDTNEKRIETPMVLYAISADAGSSWRFADLSQYDKASIKTFVPEFDDRLFEYWK